MRNIIFAIVLVLGNFSMPLSNAALMSDVDIFNDYTLKLSEVAKGCDLIVVGRFANVGVRELEATGELLYEGASFEVFEAFKGSATGTIKVSFIVEKGNSQRSLPGIGEKYILLIKTVNPGELRVARVIAFTDAAIDLITKSLSQ
jgi:hypothetical protein